MIEVTYQIIKLMNADNNNIFISVDKVKQYLQDRLDEWNALGDRRFEPANAWGYNFIMACFDDLEEFIKGTSSIGDVAINSTSIEQYGVSMKSS